jgi:hypothetical protein
MPDDTASSAPAPDLPAQLLFRDRRSQLEGRTARDSAVRRGCEELGAWWLGRADLFVRCT